MNFSGHENTTALTHDWITPKWILRALGKFDLDPCCSLSQPWSTANTSLTVEDDGLVADWFGRVWLNPPYGSQIENWMRKMAAHRNGIALVFARTDTRWFQEVVFPNATGLLFLFGRVRFHRADGATFERKGGGGAAGAPSVLVAFSKADADCLGNCEIPGSFVVKNSRF